MMDAEESHPTVSTKKGATEDMAATETAAPKRPSIQLEDGDKSDHAHPPAEKRDAEEKSFGQLRTPKHANKTGSRDDSSPTTSGQRGFSRDTEASNQKITPDRKDANKGYSVGAPEQQPNYPTQDKTPYGHYAGSTGEGYGQYRAQGTQDASYYNARVRMMQGANPQTISPGGTGMPAAAYRTAAGGYNAAAYAMQGRYQQEGYNQGNYAAGRFNAQGYRGATGQYGYAQDARYGYGDGSRHPQYGQGLPPSYQAGQQQLSQGRPPHAHYGSQTHDPRYGNVTGFTRAVSNSFDRSTKSTDNAVPRPGVAVAGHAGKADESPTMRPEYYPQDAAQNVPDSNESVPDDDSWRQLNQVASVDNSTIRAHIQKLEQKENEERKTTPESKDKEIRQTPSNSSSLTNSPEGHGATTDGKPNPTSSKMAPLDSLSSVASAQEPMDTAASKDGKDGKPAGGSSPVSSNGSLDLMKCHSGSSGLLHSFPGTHGRSMSSSSFLLDSKRSRDERGDAETKLAAVEGLRQAPTDGPPNKKSRVEGKGDDKRKSAQRDGKPSPLPVECSPPDADADKPGAAVRQAGSGAATQPAAGRFSTSPAYLGGLDRAPSYTYSIDSMPSKEFAYPPLPPRPGSSSSSTITPAGGSAMQIDGPLASSDGHPRGDSIVGALPSWDIIHAQDSFGAGSLTGGSSALVGNFSFSQDYPMLSATGSNLGQAPAAAPAPAVANPAQAQANQQGAQQQGRHHGPPTSLAESRNQSFEGGQYHGGFARTESMDLSYTGSAAQPAAASQYQQEGYRHTGSFPPQAQSWGTASSSNSTQPTHPAASYQAAQLAQYRSGLAGTRAYAGNMMRNYSEDSAVRTSPPGPRGAAASFQPPPEFTAPLSQLRRPPPQAVYIMSSDGRKTNDPSMMAKSAAGGVYGWSQEQDDRLTEVMKKYKSPRDWEPIAKEHGFDKTAKECHERWIRYLKPGVRKGQWTDHEDAIVVEAVSASSEQPFTRWSDLAQKLPGRVGKQIRDRWVNHLNPNINHMPFSREDDLLLWDGHKQLGKRWVEISTKFFNSSRSENHIKNRWYSASFKKFIANEFGPNAHSGGGKSKSKGKKTPKSSSTPKPTNTASV